VRQSERAGDRLAGDAAFARAVAEPVLDVGDLMLPPQLLELAQDAAVVAGIAVAVVLPFPWDDRREMRRTVHGDAPLVAGVIGNPEHADFAVAPRFFAGPLDALIKIRDFAVGVRVHHAGRPAGAARVDPNHGIAVRHPALGVGHLPILIFVARTFENLRMVLDHLSPLVGVTLLIGETLGVDAVGEDDRIASVVDGPEHVGVEHEAVVHDDRLVPGNAHAVAHLGARFDRADFFHDVHDRFSSNFGYARTLPVTKLPSAAGRRHPPGGAPARRHSTMDTQDLHDRGLELRRKMFGRDAVDKRMNAFGEFGKPLQHIINAYAYGDVWSRTALPPATKSLVMVAMMA